MIKLRTIRVQIAASDAICGNCRFVRTDNRGKVCTAFGEVLHGGNVGSPEQYEMQRLSECRAAEIK